MHPLDKTAHQSSITFIVACSFEFVLVPNLLTIVQSKAIAQLCVPLVQQSIV